MDSRYLLDQLPPQYRPLGAWAYFGYGVLFSVPVIGFIFLLVFSFSEKNINRRNFARSFFCSYALAVLVAVISAILFVSIRGTTSLPQF